MRCIRVDGNDILAVHDATALARDYITRTKQPVLIEAMSYRAGHHSTSDDSTRYRPTEEIQQWQGTNNPITRLRLYLESRGAWDEVQEAETRNAARQEVLAALNEAEMAKKPPISQLFEDVYDELPHHLRDQRDEWMAHLQKYEKEYDLQADYLPEEEYVNPGKQ